MQIVKDFLTYISIDTTANPTSNTTPSSPNQLVLANLLAEQLTDLKFDVQVSEQGVVYAKLKGFANKAKIGLVAHLDTSNDGSSDNIQARIIENYDGKAISLSKDRTLDPSISTNLQNHVGKTLIVSDGKNLLGADDKAGVAVIMEIARYYHDKQALIGDLYIAFTPDEEIGQGTDNFDYSLFPVDYAYTIDGSAVNTLEYENFNAANAVIEIYGNSIHPGSAKNQMVNSLLVAMDLEAMLPKMQKPQYTENREGFIHLTNMEGTCEKTTMHYIIREHDAKKFAAQQEHLIRAVNFLKDSYGVRINSIIKQSYENMYNYLQADMRCVNVAKAAIESVCKEVKIEAIRGGTDGARLSANGVLTPNIGAGGYNFHGPYEYLVIEELLQSVEIVKFILENNDKYN